MNHIIEELHKECLILPFRPDKSSHNNTSATTIAALVAVTIMHDETMSAEEKLLEIIEKSGEAEVLNNEDAFSELGLHPSEQEQISPSAANDNCHPVQLV
jgi:hypothetical protein